MYPQYKKIINEDAETVALLCQEESSITVLMPANNAIMIKTVATFEDVGQMIGGQIVDVDATEYESILFKDWGFNMSDEILNASEYQTKPETDADKLEGSLANGKETTDTPETEKPDDENKADAEAVTPESDEGSTQTGQDNSPSDAEKDAA